MGNTLESPRTEKEGEYYVSQATGLTAGATGMQGWRLEMEDSHVAVDVEGAPGHMFLAVFDGHAGAGAAKYASLEIISRIKATSSWAEYTESNFTSIKALGDALTEAFITIDVDLRKHQEGTSGRDSSGCTSVTAMITPTHIVCANAGDSRCVMGTAGTTKELSADHKPTGEIERERIEKAGGFVQWSRVDGDLAVSRALGDFGYKSTSLEAKDQKISCVPDIREHVRTPEDDVLILACDGLWDVMSSVEAVNTVREIYLSGERNALLIAEEMIDLALNKGSKDNISSVIVILPGAKFGPESQGGVAARRKQRQEADNTAARPDSYPGSPDGKSSGPGDSPASKDDV